MCGRLDEKECASQCLQIPAGHVWLQGDNTRNSNDSRHYGPVPMALLQSKVVCRVRALSLYPLQSQPGLWYRIAAGVIAIPENPSREILQQ